MIQFLKSFFMSLGVVFLAILLYGAYFAYSNDIDPRALFSSSTPSPRAAGGGEASTGAAGEASAETRLSASQEAALRAMGIDPAILTSLTETQKTCIYAAVGQARAAEIIAGATPSASELFKAKGCL